jgi:ABC-type Co2+ transport system permease subunit
MLVGGNRVLAWYLTSVLGDSSFQYTWAASTLNTSADTGFGRYSAAVIKSTNGTTSITGLFGGGAAVASAAALPLPTGNVFHVTGTTNVTSITSTNFAAGACITIIFDGVLTFTDGSNLKLAGNFVTTADDTITLCYDGTNWHETARSVN